MCIKIDSERKVIQIQRGLQKRIKGKQDIRIAFYFLKILLSKRKKYLINSSLHPTCNSIRD